MEKEYTDKEVRELIDKFYKEIIADSPNKKSLDCAFRNDKGERHCRATTHKNCTSKCKYFQPTVMAKYRRLITYIDRVRTENKLVKKENRTLETIIRLEKDRAYCNQTWADEFIDWNEPLLEDE